MGGIAERWQGRLTKEIAKGCEDAWQGQGRGSGRGGWHRGAGDGGANGRVAVRPFRRWWSGQAEGDGRSKGGFLRLLPLCGWSLELAYKACGLLAWLYPEHGVRIAEKIIGENLSR
jgi:hypothetical protein